MSLSLYNIILIVIFLIILVVLVLLSIYSFEIFSPIFVHDNNYGKYSEEIIGECITHDNHCNQTGLSSLTKTCIPSKENSGCFSNGKVTFSTKITIKPCLISCRQSMWQTIDTTECSSKLLNQVCISENQTTTKKITQLCVPHDATGINGCTINNPTYLPDGCIYSTDKTTINCKIGSTYISEINCKNYLPTCGTWGLRTGTPFPSILGLPVLSDEISLATTPCVGTTAISQSNLCYSFKNNQPIEGDSNLMTLGYLGLPMGCVKKLDQNIQGNFNINPKEPFNMGDGSICKTDQYKNIFTESYTTLLDTSSDVEVLLKKGLVSTSLFKSGETIVPSCNRLCVYISEVKGNWNPQIKRLINNFNILKKEDLFLSLNNYPCPQNVSDMINYSPNKTQILESYYINSNQPALSNCQGNPLERLQNTNTLMINQKIKFPKMLLNFKPTREMTNCFVLYAKILGSFNGEYLGVLTYNSSEGLIWKQSNLKGYLDGIDIDDPIVTEFKLTFHKKLFSLKIENQDIWVNTGNGSVNLNNISF